MKYTDPGGRELISVTFQATAGLFAGIQHTLIGWAGTYSLKGGFQSATFESQGYGPMTPTAGLSLNTGFGYHDDPK